MRLAILFSGVLIANVLGKGDLYLGTISVRFVDGLCWVFFIMDVVELLKSKCK